MNSGRIKFYLAIAGVLAAVFGAVAAAVSVRAGAGTVGVLVGMVVLFNVIGGLKPDSIVMKIVMGCALLLAMIFLAVAAVVSVRAAAVAVGVLALLAGGLGYYVHHTFFRALVNLGKSMESAFSMEVRLEPKRRRNKRNRQAVESLAAELTALGFVPAGFYKVANQDLFVEGWARPDLRLYAMITECEIYEPYAEISAYYADGGSFTVSATEVESIFERPVNMITVNLPGARPTKLLNSMMQRRPQAALLEAPPENFKAVVEEEADSLRDFVISRAEDEDDGQDEDEFYETRAENGQ